MRFRSMREDAGATEFLGYDAEAAEGKVMASLVDGVRVDEAAPGAQVQVVVNQTPFYGESGGQVGDTGAMFTADGAEVAVTDTQKKLGVLHVHTGTLAHRPLRIGDIVELRVDGRRRTPLRATHSATHQLHTPI